MIRKVYTLRQLPPPKLNSPLLQYSRNRYSQSGEDGILEEVTDRLGIRFGTFVEFGAWDGLKFSNCAFFARQKDWSGVFIEGDENRFSELVENYREKDGISCLNRWVGYAKEDNLRTLLESENHSLDIDLLSIDIDGNDYHVLSAMGVTPKVIIVEINPSIPNDVYFVQEANPAINQGSSLLAFLSLAEKMGYSPACCTSANLILVKSELFDLLGIPRFRCLSDLYSPKCNGRIFHGFDGMIYSVGMPRLIWHKNIKIDPQDLQVLKTEDIRLKLYEE